MTPKKKKDEKQNVMSSSLALFLLIALCVLLHELFK
jgi:hypothetical protein